MSLDSIRPTVDTRHSAGKEIMTLTKRKDIDMTRGPIFTQMLVFVLPLIFTNLLQVLYNATDMIVVGLSSEPDAVGAIGTTGSFVSLIVNLFIGLSVGANVVIARHIGAGDHERASRAVHTSALVGLLVGVLGGGIGIFISRPVMVAMGNVGKLLELSVLYTRIYFGALPFHALSNYAIAIHRAKGDTRTPLIVLSLSGLLNVGLNLFFVLVLDMSVDGVAIATGAAAAVSAAVLFANLARDKGPCHFSLRALHLDVTEMKQILLIGIPSGVQGALFAISNMIIQSSIIQVNNTLCDPNAAYQPIVKGSAAVANLEGFAYTAVNAVSHATISYVSQNLGAANYERITKVRSRAYLLDLGIAIFASGVLLLFRAPLLALYGVHNSATDALAKMAFDAAMTRMMWGIAPYALISFMEVGAGVLRGLGRSMTSTVICLITACAMRIVWINTAFRLFPTLDVIFMIYPISWTMASIPLFFVADRILRHMMQTKTDA